MCIVWRSFGHCGDIVMLLCTRDGIVDSKTKSVASQLFSYALSYCRRAIRYKMKKRSQSYSIFHFRALPSRLTDSDVRPFSHSLSHTQTHMRSQSFLHEDNIERNFIHDGSLFSPFYLPRIGPGVVQYFRVEFLYPSD